MGFLNVGAWLAQHALRAPEKTGLVDAATGARFNYGTLNLRARALAAYLEQHYQVQPGMRVAVLALNAPEYLDAFFACALLGALLVPLNWRLTLHELTTILDDCAPALLLHDSAHASRATELAHAMPASLALCSFATFPGPQPRLADLARSFESADGEDVMMILYTSGTTGKPKGVMLSQRMITRNAQNTALSWGLHADDITPTFAPFFHAGGLHVLTTPLLYLGGTVVLLPASRPQTILQAMQSERCTVVFAVPTVFQQMVEHPTFASTAFSALRFCVTGGSSCPLTLIRAYAQHGLEFRQGYGLTEAGVNCFSLAPEDAIRKAGSVGRPIFHSQAQIVDADDRPVAPGEVGELALAGPHICSGYWHQPEATAEAYRGGWWHTGDLARCDAEGYYFIVGRKKEMFISGGENIYPAEIEGALVAHPQVLEAAVIPRPDARWGEVGVAVVVPRVPGSLSEQELLAHCASRLARYKLPRTIYFAESLPRNVMGKVMKAALAQRFLYTPR